MEKLWHTSRRKLSYKKTLVMGILNVTPDSFSDGGKFLTIDDALRQAERMIEEGADILDIGGESTRPGRPGSARVSVEEEIARTAPVIEAITKRFDTPISIDTSKAEVAQRALEAGAEIINDVSGLRFDEKIAEVAARAKAGLVLMHLRGSFETMHRQEPAADIIQEVENGLKWSIAKAAEFGVENERIVLDAGLGFGKTFEQNLELIAKLDRLCAEFTDFPMLVGPSRKSFIGKLLGDAPVEERLQGTMAIVALAVWNGANIVRVHDVKEAVETARAAEAIKGQK